MDEVVRTTYDLNWPARYEVEAARVRTALGESLVVGMEHVGSTSIPGLDAKPIVDILVVVNSFPAARAAVPELEVMGYAFWYDNPKTDRLFFVKGLPPNGPRTFHVHVVEVGHPAQEELTLFRDVLRADPGEAVRYATLKHTLATEHSADREAYTEGKAEYIASVLAQARAARHS